jgi:fermentation-respiration switch protein FrsA (DUF1100 family)
MPRLSRVLVLAVACVVAIAVTLMAIWAAQRRLIYFPMGGVPSAADFGTHVTAVSFPTADGLDLNAWWFPAAMSPPRATVLVFNGNAGNRAYRVPLAEALRRRGFHVLLVDYRGFGGNPGMPTERGLAADSRAAYTYVATRADVDASRLVYFGESLGSAVAVDLASERPPSALILRSPFTSMVDIGRHHYPLLPVRWLLRDRFAPIDRIGRIRSPILVIAGDRDSIVPLEHSRRLYDAAGSPKALKVIRGADHNDDELLAGDEMIEAIVEFIARYVAVPSQA